MSTTAKLAAALLCAAAALHCSSKTNLCASVACDGGQSCDPSDGTCKPESFTDGGGTCVPVCNPSLPVCDTSHTPPICKVCTATAGCSGATPICDPSQGNGLGACQVCTPAAGCSGATPVCDVAVPGGQCVQCLSNGDCTPATPVCDPVTSTCVTADGGLANATCTGATALVFDGGVATASGDDTNSINSSLPGDQSPNCSTAALQTGKAVVFTFTLSGAQDVTVSVTPTGAPPTLAPVVYVRAPGKCTSGALADQLSCDVRGAGAASATTLYDLPAGTYPVWISSDGSTSAGPFTVTVSLAPPTPPPPNETCATAQALAFSGGVATVGGTTRGAAHTSELPDAGSPSCSQGAASDGFDVVYTYTLSQPQDVTVTVTPTAGSALEPVVFVRAPNACASTAASTELACDNPVLYGEGTTADIRLLNQAAGTYFVWVSGDAQTAGDFQLTATLSPPTSPPANATCTTAQALSFPTAGLSGTTYGSVNLLNDQCSGVPLSLSGPEVVYSFSVAVPSHFQATVTPVDGGSGPGLFPYAYVRDAADCTQVTDQGSLACVTASVPGGPATLVASDLSAGNYNLIVDSYRTTFATPSGGGFTLDATLTAAGGPPTNTSCASAQLVSLTPQAGGMLGQSLQGDSTGASDATALSCTVTTSAAMPYVVYQLDVPALGPGVTGYNARASIYGENDDALVPGVSLTSTCGSSAGEYDCGVERGAFGDIAFSQQVLVYAQAVAVALGLDGGEALYAVVGSTRAPDAGGIAGPFGATFELAPVPAPNDQCATAVPLAANASVPGSTLGAADDYDLFNGYYQTASDAGFQCQDAVLALQDDMTGADVVYSYTAAATGPVTVTVEPEPGFDVALGVLAACSPNQCIGFSDAAFEGGAERVTFAATAGSTYYLLVDGSITASDRRGGFVISAGP